MTKKRIVAALAAVVFLNITAWAFGFNFDHRGFGLGLLVYGSISAAFLAYNFPGL